MDKTSALYKTYLRILREELIPAMGCTEPIAIAYAAAKAREVLGRLPGAVWLGVSSNIIKNVKSVIVPNTGGMKGIEAAAAAGIVGGQAEQALEDISEVTDEQKTGRRRFLADTPIQVEAVDNGQIFDIIVRLTAGEETASVRIARYHTNIVRIEKNGAVLLDKPLEEAPPACGHEGGAPTEDGLAGRELLTIADILDFADSCELADIRPVLDTQIQYNTLIAEEGLLGDYGANIGSTMLKFYGDDVRNRAIAKAAAGSDARMSGCELPVVINSGSGNQGITCSVPIIVYAKYLAATEETLYRALVLSNLTALLQKRGIGRLSAFCGAVCAACGSGAGITYLHGGDYDAISRTITNTLANASGIVCDGAKGSCAAKIATSVDAAILGHEMSLDGNTFGAGEGLVKENVEKTIASIGRMAADGMRETDSEILRIMIDQGSGC